ncbi:MAG: heparan-alpha-glucosaminide N-acetyltransferase domain-containing protein [Candidatus Heimdallarchaeota archaeon]
MSSEEEWLDMDSIPLFDYLKKEVPVDDLKDVASPRRIKSIDFVKGLAIIFVILAHTASSWLDYQWIYLYGIMYALLDILGPSLFVFLSALSVIFSVRRKEGVLPNKVIRNGIIMRGVVIMVIGILFNIPSVFILGGGILNIWNWNILVFIGFSQIVSLYAFKLGKTTRAIIGTFIIFTSDAIRQFLFDGEQAGNIFITIIRYIVVSPNPMTPLIPFLSICFLSTIFGEYLYDAMIDGTKQAYTVLFRIFLFWGITLILIGIVYPFIIGTPLQTPSTLSNIDYPHLDLLATANSQTFTDFRFSGMPDFLIRGRSSNMCYNLGWALFLIAICFYLIDIKGKSNSFTGMLIYYGKVSLSLFLVHYTFISLFYRSLNLLLFIFIWLAFTGLMGFLMYMWIEFAKGVGSPEYLIVQIGRIGQKTTYEIKKETHLIAEKIKKEHSKES